MILLISVLSLFHPDQLVVTSGSTRTLVRLEDAPRRFAGPVTITLPGKITRRYPADLEIRREGSELRAIVHIDREAAAASAAHAEAPEAPVEARKAQAVLARSYYRIPRHREFDFCDTTHCQLFQDPPPPSAIAAAEATRGRTVIYRDQPVAPLFFRSCAGRTRSARSVGLSDTPYPYFEIECETCLRSPARWQFKLPSEAIDRLRQGPANENLRLELAREFGWKSLRSNDYRIEDDTVRGAGEGHGVGVCQRGAAGLARKGLDFSAILLYFLPGITLSR